ncbi:hypothetical protein SNL152K_10597 [Streptomyces sp. NL15-2K]|nr:hypothetical protein SNL152K_10597 [Streptomyces sp. NL15-2K]
MRHLEPVQCSRRTPYRRTRTVRRQLQHLHAGQLVPPELQLLVVLGAVPHPFPLPYRVVGVLHGQQRQFGPLAVQRGRVGGADLAREDAEGPAVADDVVHRQQKDVLLRAEARQEYAEERSGAQIEGLQQTLPEELVGGAGRCGRVPVHDVVLTHGFRGGRQVDVHDGHFHRVVHDLDGTPVHLAEGRAERLVPPDHVRHGLPQGIRVERSRDPEGQPGVVLDTTRLELVDEPEPLLGEGGGDVALAGGPGDARVLRRPARKALSEQFLHVLRQRADPALPGRLRTQFLSSRHSGRRRTVVRCGRGGAGAGVWFPYRRITLRRVAT